MMRIKAAPVLIAASFLGYMVTLRDTFVQQDVVNTGDGGLAHVDVEIFSNQKFVPEVSVERRRTLSRREEEKRLTKELSLFSRQLQLLSHHVDWEKLHDEYLIAIFSTDHGNHRQLKKRGPRPRRHGQNSLNLAGIQDSLEKEAYDAIERARGYGKPEPEESSSGEQNQTKVGAFVGGTMTGAKDVVNGTKRQGDSASFNGKPIPAYSPSRGNCPGPGNVATIPIPCAPDNLNQICDKYDDAGTFKACFEACKPSFCCVHDAPPATNLVSPNCNTDVNCAQYGVCYIVWWKLHDTVGPATQLRLEQNDDFFDVNASEIANDQTNSIFYREMLFHHFDDSNEIIRLGTVQVNATYSVFSSDLIFLNSTYWNTTI